MHFFFAFSFLLCFVLSSTLCLATTELYVSTQGKGNACSLPSPSSLAAAKEKVHKLNRNMNADIIIYLRGGIYPLIRTLTFTNQDSGNNGFSVIYRAYNNENPIFSGGTKISGWTLHEKGIYKAKVTGHTFRQL